MPRSPSAGMARRIHSRGTRFVDLAEELASVLRLDAARQREELLRLSADAVGDRANWWLGVVQFATSCATAEPASRAERQQWTRLAVVALDPAFEDGGLPARDIAGRKANLTLALSRFGAPTDFSQTLRPDDVARACLNEVRMSPEEAVSTRWEYRAEDVGIMRDLRAVRNQVVPALGLA